MKFFLIKNILTKYTVETTASYFVRRFLIKRISIVASRFLRAAQRAHTRARARAQLRPRVRSDDGDDDDDDDDDDHDDDDDDDDDHDHDHDDDGLP